MTFCFHLKRQYWVIVLHIILAEILTVGFFRVSSGGQADWSQTIVVKIVHYSEETQKTWLNLVVII